MEIVLSIKYVLNVQFDNQKTVYILYMVYRQQ